MARDNVIETVVRNWAQRFISNGVPLFDYQEVTDGLEAWDDWCAAWSARAAEHEAAGRAALAEGCTLSAGQHLQTAAVIYHFAKFVFVHDMDLLKATNVKGSPATGLPCRTSSLRASASRYLSKVASSTASCASPQGATRPPVVIMCMGLDSAKEEMATNEAHFLARGLATLAFDGPGQGEAEYKLAMRPDYEAAVAAVADFVETRSDLDSDRIASGASASAAITRRAPLPSKFGSRPASPSPGHSISACCGATASVIRRQSSGCDRTARRWRTRTLRQEPLISPASLKTSPARSSSLAAKTTQSRRRNINANSLLRRQDRLSS